LEFFIVFHVLAPEDETAPMIWRKAVRILRQQNFFNLSESRRRRETQLEDTVALIAPAKVVVLWSVSGHLVDRRKSALAMADSDFFRRVSSAPTFSGGEADMMI
jgi:hypothetical protein